MRVKSRSTYTFFIRSALCHMKTRFCFKYFVHDRSITHFVLETGPQSVKYQKQILDSNQNKM